MSPGHQLCRNIAGAISAAGISNAYAHDSGTTMGLPSVSVAYDNALRLQGLPGIYDVTGRIIRRSSPEDETMAERAQACATLWDIVADIPAMESAIDTNLRIYIFKIEGDNFAEDDPLFEYTINYSAKISTNP